MRFLSLFAVAVVALLLIAGDASAFGRRARRSACSSGSCGVARPATCLPAVAGSCSAGLLTPASTPASSCPGGVCLPAAGGFILR